jgi:hypothetical protein
MFSNSIEGILQKHKLGSTVDSWVIKVHLYKVRFDFQRLVECVFI